MKLKYLILLLLTVNCLAFSQSDTVFNYNYPYDWNYDCNVMLYNDSAYYLAGDVGRIKQGCGSVTYGYHITKIDSLGKRDTTIIYDKCGQTSYMGWKGSINQKDGFTYVLGRAFDYPEYNKLFLLKLDSSLDTVSNVYFMSDTLTKRAFSFVFDDLGNIVFCGGGDSTYNEMAGYPDTTFSKSYLCKVSQSGEIIWQRSYSFGDISDGCWSSFERIINTYDKGYIVTGLTSDYGNSRNFIMKTDSLGSQEWVRLYGNHAYDNPTFQDIIETRDSCYIVCGAYVYGEVFGGLYPFDGWLIKVDNEGMPVWDRKYREHRVEPGDYRDSIYCHFFSICELDDDNLIVAGTARKESGFSNRTPFVYFINSDGDTISSKYYFRYSIGHPDYVNTSNPTTVLITVDSGFAIAGWAEYVVYDSIGDQWLNPQRIFLIKTDSLGNDTTVNNIIHHQTIPITKFNLVCYPNPASFETFVDIPQEIREDVLLIYSTNGTIVHEQTVMSGENRIDLCGIKPGMYLLKLQESGLFGKLIVK